MVEKVTVLRAEGWNPYRNQAIEKYLLDSCGENEWICYLWANDKTVFIGKNQNAYTECRLSSLKEDGGFLARRFTGGGAVYHDKGNCNFSFITRKENFDLDFQFSLLESAFLRLGIRVERSGRNDLTIEKKKFSGNAFYRSEGSCLHHGTILIASDYEAIEKYLSASSVKLSAKGVKSVQSRVGNLSEFCPGITAEKIACSLEERAAEKFPHALFCRKREKDLPEEEIEKLRRGFADEEYLLGDNVFYDAAFESRFEWGTADVRLGFRGNIIERARIYSDSLDPDGVAFKETLLRGTDLSHPDPRIKDIIIALEQKRHEV